MLFLKVSAPCEFVGFLCHFIEVLQLVEELRSGKVERGSWGALYMEEGRCEAARKVGDLL